MQKGQQSRMPKAITPTNTALNTAMPVLTRNRPHQLRWASAWRASPCNTSGTTANSNTVA